MTALNLTGYHLTYDAEMTSASDMQFLNNTFNNGDRTIASNGEEEYYASYDPNSPTNPFSFQNGALVITASPTPQGGLPYTSGMVTTGYSHYQNQGYFEIRAELPSGAGFWPAFWMLAGGPTDFWSELDILEQPNNDGIQNYYDSIKTASYTNGGFQNTGIDLSTSYHTYGLLWTATTMQFMFDGNSIGPAIPTPASLATQQMYMIANLAVGGYWAGSPASGASAQLKIDYMRAYSNDPSVGGWSLGTISSPDGVDTTPNLTGTTTTTTAAPVTTTTTSTTTTTTTTSSSVPNTVVLGSGSDMLSLQVAEDAYQGDAQFTISVDGQQVGGTQTVTALKSTGSTQAFDVLGSFGTGTHTATITFLNDTYGGTPSTDRNLYVTQASINNTSVSSSALNEYDGGSQSFSFKGTTSSTTPTPSLLTLHLAEDAYQGNAQFVVTIDGTQMAPAQSVSALQSKGGSQAFSFADVLAAGTHDVGVTFTNDAYGGSPTADRNLYVGGADLNGTALSTSAWTASLFSNGTTHFNLVVPS